MSNQLVVIDLSVVNYKSLIDQLGASYSYLLLDADSDGVTQIANYVAANPGFDAIHLISHGAPGQVAVGTSTLSEATLGGYTAQLSQIGASLNAGGDLLIYGCEVAQGAVGQQLISELSLLTRLDVAASINTTGSEGDWVLEAKTGPIENSLPKIQYIGDLATMPTTAWTRSIGSNSSAQAMVIGLDGSVYVAGNISVITVDGNTDSSRSDAFVTKFAADGTKIWTKPIGTSAYNVTRALSIGSDGSLYVAGYTDSNYANGVDYYQMPEGDPKAGEHYAANGSGYLDEFITKFAADGTEVWTKLLTPTFILGTNEPSSARPIGLATSRDGSVYVGGSTMATYSVGPLQWIYSEKGSLSKYAADGTKIWTKIFPSAQYPFVLTTGLDGNVYGAGALGFISKFGSDGTEIWSSISRISSSDDVTALSIGLDGSVYVSGTTHPPVTSYGAVFLTKLDANGVNVWTNPFGSPSNDYSNPKVNTLTTGLDGSIYVAGSAYDNSLENSGRNDAFVTRFGAGGEQFGTKLIGSSLDEVAEALTIGLDGSVFVSGYTSSAAFNGQTNSGPFDVFAIKLTVNAKPPTIEISSNKSSLSAGETATLTFILSEASNDFVLEDISVAGGILDDFTGGGTNYSAIFTPISKSTANGIVGVTSNKFSGAAWVFNVDGADANNTVTIKVNTLASDTTPPTIAVSSNRFTVSAGQTANVTFTLSKSSNDFALGDIYASGGTLTNFTGTGSTYTATFTPTANSTTNGLVNVASNKFSDAAGNFNVDGAEANNTVTMTVDTIRPTIAVASDKGNLRAGQAATLTFALSEPSTDFGVSDIAFSGGGLSNFTGVGASYTATFTPNLNSTANGVVSVASNNFSDAAGNFNVDGAEVNNTVTMTVDTVPPTIAVTSSKLSLGARETATLTFALSETATDFVASDIATSGGTLSNFSGSGSNYTATFTPDLNNTTNGVVSVSSNTFRDAVGNFNVDGADTNNTVTIMVTNVPPTPISQVLLGGLTPSSAQGQGNSPATVTISGVSGAPTLTNVKFNATGSNAIYFNGTSQLNIVDGDLNFGTKSFAISFEFKTDNTTPYSTIIDNGGSFQLADFDGAFRFNGGGISKGTLKDNVWHAIAVVRENNALSFYIDGALEAVKSVAPNYSVDFSSFVLGHVKGEWTQNWDNSFRGYVADLTIWNPGVSDDIIPPTISLASSKSSLLAAQTATLTFTLSELSNDFVASDITVSGGTLSNFSGNSTSYSATFTPTANSTTNGVVSVASSKFSDAAGNFNVDGAEANNTVTMTVNTVPAVNTTPLAVAWTRLIGGSNGDYGQFLGTGPDGSLYVGGNTSSSNIDGQSNAGTGGSYDVFVTKYSGDGTKIWTRLIGSGGTDYGNAITIGGDGSIYVGGYTDNPQLGGQNGAGGGDAFVRKFDASGNNLWTRLIGSSNPDGAYGLATAADGSIYVTGDTRGPILDGQTGFGSGDAFLTKYTPVGEKIWTRLVGAIGYDFPRAVRTGSDGSIYIAGFTDSPTLDGQTNAGGQDGFVSKFAPDGTKVWTRLIGSTAADLAENLTIGLDGSIYVLGNTASAVIDGQVTLGQGDVFISKFSPDGSKLWTRTTGGSGSDSGSGITTGLDGAIYVSGETRNSLGGQSNSGLTDAFITKFLPDGTAVWSKLVGGTSWDRGSPLSTGPDGSIYLGGSTSSYPFNGQSGAGDFDAFIVKLIESESIPPTIAISSNQSRLWAGQTATLTFTFSEPVRDFVASDITLSGGTLANVTGSGTAYTATFTPTANSTINAVISVTSDKFSDAAGNFNVDGADANNSVTMTVNTTPYIPVTTGVFGGHTYEIYAEKFSWTDAESFAKQKGGYLVSITSEAENNYVAKLRPAALSPWIGLYQTDFTNEPAGGWVWDSGEVSAYRAWAPGEPNNDQGIEGYAHFFTAPWSIYGWNDFINSGGVLPFSSTNVAATGFIVEYGSVTPPKIAVSSDKSSLFAGQAATLTFTLSRPSTDFILGDIKVAGGTLSNFSGSGAAYSATFTPTANSTTNGVVSVISNKFSDAAGIFNVDGADADNTVTMTVKTTPIIPVATGFFDGHNYDVYSEPLSWTDAQAFAKSQGGYLVSISSESENKFVAGLKPSNLKPWIGLYQTTFTSEPAGGWVWDSGEVSTYRAWGGANQTTLLRLWGARTMPSIGIHLIHGMTTTVAIFSALSSRLAASLRQQSQFQAINPASLPVRLQR